MISRYLTLVLLALTAAGAAGQTPAARERVAPEGPYRSQVRLLDEKPPAEPSAGELLRSADGYARALILRQLALQGIASGDTNAAIDNLEQALALGSLAPLATAQMQANLGQLYAAAGRHDEAVAVLQQAMAAGVDTPALQMTLASAALATSRYDIALDAARLGLRDAAEPADDWLRVAVYAAWQAGQSATAVPWQRRLLDRAPDNPDNWLQLVALYRASGQPELAAATLTAAAAAGIVAGTDDLLRLVSLHYETGTPDIAAQWLQRLLARDPQPRYWQWLAQLHLRARDDVAALAALERWAQLEDSPDAWLQTGELALALDDTQRALPALRKASASGAPGPVRARALLLLGQALVNTGQFAAARRVFRQATEYGGNAYRVAQQWLETLPRERATDAAAVAAAADQPGAGEAQPAPTGAPAAAVETKTVPAMRVYGISQQSSGAQLAADASALARDLVRTTRRERLEWTGPLQIVVEGDVSDPAQPVSLSVAAPIRRVAPARGRFRSGELDTMRCSFVRYEGPWEGLPAAWRALYDTTVAAGHQPSGEARQLVLHRGNKSNDSIVELQIGIL